MTPTTHKKAFEEKRTELQRAQAKVKELEAKLAEFQASAEN